MDFQTHWQKRAKRMTMEEVRCFEKGLNTKTEINWAGRGRCPRLGSPVPSARQAELPTRLQSCHPPPPGPAVHRPPPSGVRLFIC